MQTWVLILFVVTYAGVALGRIPGLTLDRTGIALLGAIAMVSGGAVTIGEASSSIDTSTILLLYSLMIVSAQLRLGGFYTRTALRMTAWLHHPRLFLLTSMLVSAVFSAILANDIVCLAFTPVLAVSALRARLNPVPFLLGLAISSNIGSAATLIGNPQNMLIGQIGQLDFAHFLFWCAPPSLLSLGAAYLILCLLYRNRWTIGTMSSQADETSMPWPAYDAWQSKKGLIAVGLLMVLFFTPIPRELSALAIAGILLCSRHMKSRKMLELVDWHLITLFCALFVVIEGIEKVHLPEIAVNILTSHGIELTGPYVLTAVTTAMSNLVSNVPATMLLIKFLDPAQVSQWYILALASTFAGNLFVIGSIANLIVIEQARGYGVIIGFREHARAGVPITLVSLSVLIGWIISQS